MAFVRRYLSFTVVLQPDSSGSGATQFQGTNSNTVTITGASGQPIWASASINKAGLIAQSQLDSQIFGLPLSLQNQLSTLGKPFSSGILVVGKNQVTVQAWDDNTQPATVFQGTSTAAWSEFSGIPKEPFIIQGVEGIQYALNVTAPSSFQGSVSAAEVMSVFATNAGLTFENAGVNVMLSNPYFPGTLKEQIDRCAKAANIAYVIENGVLAIWPKGSNRQKQIPLITPPNMGGSMMGYPAYTAGGVVVKILFDPSIVFGQQIQIQSSVTPANGTWTVNIVSHELDTQPNGPWFTVLKCFTGLQLPQ